MNPIRAGRVRTIGLVGGLLLVSIGLWVAPAAAPPPVRENPFAGVTQKLGRQPAERPALYRLGGL